MLVIPLPFNPLGHHGLACRWFVLVHKDYKNDERLLDHERIHIRQQKTIGIVRYLLNYFVNHWLGDSSFRAQVEHEAFLKGSRYSKETIRRILVERYGINPDLARETIAQDI